MDKLLELLNGLFPDIDFENETKLMSDHVLDSASVVSIISEIEDAFSMEDLK